MKIAPAPFLFLFLISLVFPGCTKEPDYLYKVTSLGLFNVDNTGTTSVVATSGTVAARAYCIGMAYTAQVTGSTSGRDPNESGYSLYTKVTHFDITCTTDFDMQHPAGSSLNGYFYYGPYGTLVNAGDSIPGALATNLVFYAYRPNVNVNSWPDTGYLVLMQPPPQAFLGPRTFILNVAFADSTGFTDSIYVNLN